MLSSAVSIAIRARWAVQWGATTTTSYDNKPFTPTIGIAWVRLAIRDGDARQASIGPSSIDRHSGVVFVQIFAPLGQGEDRARWLADRAATVFRKVELAAGSSLVTFRVPSIAAIEPGGDDWWQVNVVCPYFYDEAT